MSKTAEGLRDRLFDTLDALIEKRISSKEVEGICYVSEQIIKTANTELELIREQNRFNEYKMQHEITMKREEKDAIKMIGKTIESIEVIDE
jgi:hypothetical protein